MKDTLRAGISKTVRVTVDRARTIDFMGEECRVYATPSLVRDIESTARDLIAEHLDPGEDTVGTRVEVDHLAPTLMDMWVEITATIAEVKGRAVTLEISARDALDEVARGTHARFVVDVAKTAERLKGKAAKVRAA